MTTSKWHECNDQCGGPFNAPHLHLSKREEPDSRMTVQDLIDRLSLLPKEIRNRYIAQVGGEHGMGDLTARGFACNHLDETVCLDNDPM